MSVTVDFVAFDDERDTCLLVLVEEGPWTGSLDDHLRLLQERLYGCLEAALDGQVAENFPKAAGKSVVVRVDCYDLPVGELNDFVERFAAGVRQLPDYSPETSPWVRSFEFEVNHEKLS